MSTTDKPPTIEEIVEARAKQAGEWFDIPHPDWEGGDHRVSALGPNAYWGEFGHIATVSHTAAQFIANAPPPLHRLPLK